MSRPFSFVQITDIHIGLATSEALAEDLRQIEAQVGGEAAFIAVTGDITHLGTAKEYQDYLLGIRATSLKTYPVPGNHDYMNGEGGDTQGGPACYEKLVAPLNYSFDHRGVHFVAYDCIPGENEKRPSQWLIEDLSKLPAGAPVIFLVHYPLEDGFYQQLKSFNIVGTLSGHWHSSRTFDDGKTLHFNTSPLCFGGIDFSPRCYRIFTWNGRSLIARTVPFQKQTAVHGNKTQDLEVRWSAPLEGNVMLGAPVVQGGRVFVSLMNEDNEREKGGVGCWDATTGRPLWRTGLRASVKNSPLHSGGTLFVTTVTGQVVALEAASGKIRWDYQIGDPSQRWIFSSPAVHNGRLFAGQRNCFTALDAATGQQLFQREDLSPRDWLPVDWISSYCSPVGSGNRIFAGFFLKSFHCLDALTGETLWRIDDNGDFDSSPALDGNGFLYVAWQGHIGKLDATNGKSLWKSPTAEGWCPATPLYHDDTIYTVAGHGKLFAFDAADGREKWRWEAGMAINDTLPYLRDCPSVLSSPRMMGRHVLIGCNDGRLVGLDRATGASVWAHQFDAPISATPAIDGDSIYLPVCDGRLYALNRR